MSAENQKKSDAAPPETDLEHEVRLAAGGWAFTIANRRALEDRMIEATPEGKPIDFDAAEEAAESLARAVRLEKKARDRYSRAVRVLEDSQR